MGLLEELKQQFGWEKAIAVEEQIIDTDVGLKRIRHWEDQELLDWHIHWRDHCSVTPIVLTDRMIRTQDSEAFVPWKSAWVTVHDEIPHSFMQNENGQVWGTFFGVMVRYGIRSEREITYKEREKPDLKTFEKKLWSYPIDFQPTLRNMLHEAKRRQSKAEDLQNRFSSSPLPLTDSMIGFEQAKDIHGMLHWTGSEAYPEKGYYGIRSFLREWLQRYETATLQSVLDQIEQVYPDFSKEQGALLLAECLVPYEMNPLLSLSNEHLTYEEVETSIVKCKQEWQISKQMVDDLANWLDGRHAKDE